MFPKVSVGRRMSADCLGLGFAAGGVRAASCDAERHLETCRCSSTHRLSVDAAQKSAVALFCTTDCINEAVADSACAACRCEWSVFIVAIPRRLLSQRGYALHHAAPNVHQNRRRPSVSSHHLCSPSRRTDKTHRGGEVQRGDTIGPAWLSAVFLGAPSEFCRKTGSTPPGICISGPSTRHEVELATQKPHTSHHDVAS